MLSAIMAADAQSPEIQELAKSPEVQYTYISNMALNLKSGCQKSGILKKLGISAYYVEYIEMIDCDSAKKISEVAKVCQKFVNEKTPEILLSSNSDGETYNMYTTKIISRNKVKNLVIISRDANSYNFILIKGEFWVTGGSHSDVSDLTEKRKKNTSVRVRTAYVIKDGHMVDSDSV